MSTKPEPRVRAYIALIIGLFSIGFSAIFVRMADVPGTVAAFYRMGIAAVVFAVPFFRQTKRRHEPLPQPGIWLALLAGLLFALDLSFWATGIGLSGATTPTLMANTAPVWVGLGSLVLFRERLSGGFWAGLAIAMIGAVLVLGTDLSHATGLGLGTFLGLMAAIFYGGYYLVTQRGRAHLSTLAYFWITVASSSLILLTFNLVLGRSLSGFSVETWLALLALGLVAQGLGWMTLNYAQGFLPASVVAPTLLGQPVVTAVLAVILLGERFTLGHILGGLGVLAGVYIVHRGRIE